VLAIGGEMSTQRIRLREEAILDLVGPEDADIPTVEEDDVTIVVVVGKFVGVLKGPLRIIDWW
jgi:hypothetical protein